MTELQKIEPKDAVGEVAELYKAATVMLGRVPNFYRFLAHSPLVAKMLLPFNAVMQRQGAGSILTAKIKEMAVIKTSKINGCVYCYAHNTSLGRAAGISDEQVMVIDGDDYMSSDLLSPREKAAVLWADHVTRNTVRDHPEVRAQVRDHFNDAEMVELTLISGMFNMFNRFMDCMGVPMDTQKDIDSIQDSLHLDPNQVKAYFAHVADNWPDTIPGPNPDS
ncbi:MAG: carboxymuconolactone decarboxylase family protein [Proteobacteria bacterium]|nr:carboxymuconolactone decarboxylase family protein [Pseudomonadota bacterium]